MSWADRSRNVTLAFSSESSAALAMMIPRALAQYRSLYQQAAAHERIVDIPETELHAIRTRAASNAYFLSLCLRTVESSAHELDDFTHSPIVLRPMLGSLVQSYILFSQLANDKTIAVFAGVDLDTDQLHDLVASTMVTPDELDAWLAQPEVGAWLESMRAYREPR